MVLVLRGFRLKEFKCPECGVNIIFEEDELGKYPHCPNCGKNWCPNYTIHGHRELEIVSNERGQYHLCLKCHWYPSIDYESNKSSITQEMFIENFLQVLKEIDTSKVSFKSVLAGEEPWFSLNERLKRYGRIRTSDLEVFFDGKPVTKFELKGWINYDTAKFYFTLRANINIDEVKDAAETDGYICFVTWQDKKVICTRAKDILREWEKKQISVPCGPKVKNKEELNKYSKLVTEKLKEGTMVLIGPDKQNNCRFIISRNFKRKYCKYLEDYSSEIISKFKDAIN